MKPLRPARRTRPHGSAAGTFALAIAAVVALAPAAAALEKIVEDLSGAPKFAPMWPGATVDHGEPSELPQLRVVTDGKGGGTLIANIRAYKPRLDLRGKFVKVWVRVDDTSRLAGMEFRLSSDRLGEDYFAFTFPRFDDEHFNVVRNGVWTPITFSFGQARVEGQPERGAINAIGWYVADKGEEKPVTAWWGGLSAIDQPAEGVVSITFDDGYAEHLEAAKRMARFGFRGTAYVIPNAIGQRGYLSHHQLVELQEKYRWDVAAHHETPFTDFSPEQLEDTILSVQRFLVENEFSEGAQHLAYPLGRQDPETVRRLVRKHFTTARVAGSGPETLPPADRHLLRVMNVTKDTTPAQVGAAARTARKHGEWLILMFHYLVDTAKIDTEYSLADFDRMLEAVKASGARVLPLTEVWSACSTKRSLATSACQLPASKTAPAAPRSR